MQLNIFIISVLFCQTANSQQRAGVEEFFYSGGGVASTVVPRIYYQGNRGWYGEARYNYEQAAAFSIYAGKTFSIQRPLSFSFTPVAGLIRGKLKEGALGANLSVDYRNFSFSSASQYAFSQEDRRSNFFYNWAELGCQLTSSIYAGLAVQQTCFYRAVTNWDPGLQVGFGINKWTFPFYIFDPMDRSRHFVFGVTREWNGHPQQIRKN